MNSDDLLMSEANLWSAACKRRFGMKASKSSADTEHYKSQAEAPDIRTTNTRDKFLTKTFLSTSWTRWENLALSYK